MDKKTNPSKSANGVEIIDIARLEGKKEKVIPGANGEDEKINPSLKSWVMNISALKLDPKNPRVHPPKNLEAIKNSLKQFGQQTPIVVNRDKIVTKGNGTVQAAKALGWKKIAAIPTDLVTKKLQTAYKVADNKTGDLADWDFQILADDIKAFADIDWKGLGWEDWELEPILAANWTPPAIDNDGHSSGSGLLTIKLTADQKAVFDRAVVLCRQKANDPEMSEGRCLELIAAEFLSG